MTPVRFSARVAFLTLGLSLAFCIQSRAEDGHSENAAAPSPGAAGSSNVYALPSLETDEAGGKDIVRLTLEDSVAEAVRGATIVQKARNEMGATGSQLIQGYAQFLPNLQTSAGYDFSQGKQLLTSATPTLVDARSHGASYQISSTLNIFNGLSDAAALSAAIARDKASRLSYARARQLIALDVAQAFLQTILDKEIVKIADKNLASSKGRERLLTEQARVGVRSLADLYRQQAQTSSDESFLTSSLAKERADELILLRKIRVDPARRYEFVAPKIDENPKKRPDFEDEGQLVDLALKSRPDLQSQAEIARAYHQDARVIRGGFFPRLDLGAVAFGGGRWLDSQTVNGADVTGLQSQSLGDQLSNNIVWTVGLKLTWNPFDRWVTKASVERANVTASNSELDTQDVRNQVVGEARQAYGEWRAALQQLETSAKGLTAAQKAYDTMNGRYQVGAASFIDLLTAQAALVQAGASRAQALIGFALQSRVVETVTGQTKLD